LLLETVGSIQEAEFYLSQIRAAKATVPVWLSFCIKTDYTIGQAPRLLTGDTLTHAVHYLMEKGLLDNVEVIMVNCCDLRIVSDCIRELHSVLGTINNNKIRIGAYPNGFTSAPPDGANKTLRQLDLKITPDVMKNHCQEWIELGATILGGCCGVGPEHIRAIVSIKSNDKREHESNQGGYLWPLCRSWVGTRESVNIPIYRSPHETLWPDSWKPVVLLHKIVLINCFTAQDCVDMINLTKKAFDLLASLKCLNRNTCQVYLFRIKIMV
jgi:hypothetical protein